MHMVATTSRDVANELLGWGNGKRIERVVWSTSELRGSRAMTFGDRMSHVPKWSTVSLRHLCSREQNENDCVAGEANS